MTEGIERSFSAAWLGVTDERVATMMDQSVPAGLVDVFEHGQEMTAHHYTLIL